MDAKAYEDSLAAQRAVLGQNQNEQVMGNPPPPGFVMPIPQPGFAGPASGNDGAGDKCGLVGGEIPPAGFKVDMSGQDVHREGWNPYSNESGRAGGDMNGFDFSEKSIRMAFIRKVYSLLATQLLITTGIIALFCFHEKVKEWAHTTPGFVLGCYAFSLVAMLSLVCCESVRRKSPQNLIMLGLFTLAEGVLVGVVASTYDVKIVVLASAVTVIICLALTLFSFQTKWDFTTMGGALFVCLIVLFIFGIAGIFIRAPILQTIIAAFGTVLFSIYLIHDTQLMMGGHKYSISPEEYVFAALTIYMDVIMIFLYLMRLFSGGRN